MTDQNESITPPFELSHLRIEAFRSETSFSPPQLDMSNAVFSRDRRIHGPKLEVELASSLLQANKNITKRDSQIQKGKLGVYLEIEGALGRKLPDLNWSSEDIRMGALRINEDGAEVGTLFVPNTAENFLIEKVREYAHEDTPNKSPKNENKFAPVEFIRSANLSSLWTDSRALPTDLDQLIWWECWTWSDRVNNLIYVAKKLQLRVSDRRLFFPELEIVPIYANRRAIELLLQNTDAIEELRQASDSPVFFTRSERKNQQIWIGDLTKRLTGPDSQSPAVCILDGGVAQAHPLLANALQLKDCLTIDSSWGVDDHDPDGHGTNMAGSVLYADLTYPLIDQRQIVLEFGLESVKFLPPPGVSLTDPQNYGSITQSAIALSEINNPSRIRVFCMAVTNEDISGERPTSWSAALDQICAGVMKGDPSEENEQTTRRLFFVSAGNIPDTTDPVDISDLDEYPIEDPAQAWNAIAVGGFTDKSEIAKEDNLPDWKAYVLAGDHSPYSRISTDWNHSTTPMKPEVVFEAGNKALSPTGNEIISGVDSLSLLTTHKDFLQEPLTTFWATSAATAQAAGMAASIIARHPEFWPETVRALIIHSAEWTPSMRERIKACKGKKKECISLARNFGYGVPNLNRALASAENDLALVAQAEIQPFKRVRKPDKKGRQVLGSPTFNEVHYYELPWPKTALEQLSNKNVQLKITLSYFVEPNPGETAPVTPSRYQSHGLRFEIKRPEDTAAIFHQRINRLERTPDSVIPVAAPDNRWTFGSQSIAAGSLHCDVWTGPAAELAARGVIAVYPVSGWWRYRTHLKRYDSKTRYSLVVSIVSDEESVKLYTEIANLIRVKTHVDTSLTI